MIKEEALEKVLRSFQAYYNIKPEEEVTPPFAAEAEYRAQDQQYFLVKAAKISESESREYVFFALEDKVDEDAMSRLCDMAWTKGTERIHPFPGHRSSDVTLVILTDEMSEGAVKLAAKQNHDVSYRFGLQGWSHFRVIALEVTSGRLAYNRQGQQLKKLFGNIMK